MAVRVTLRRRPATGLAAETLASAPEWRARCGPGLAQLRDYGLVVTTYLAIVLPTGGSADGEGAWAVAPHALVDAGLDALGLQGNAAIEVTSSSELILELRGAASLTFVVDHAGPDVVSVLAEAWSELPLVGAEPAELGVLAGPASRSGPGVRAWARARSCSGRRHRTCVSWLKSAFTRRGRGPPLVRVCDRASLRSE